MIQIPDRIIEELKEYRDKVGAYEKGEIDPVRFKPYRVAMGIYEQREKNTYMLRTRIPSGFVTWEQLKVIGQLADQFSHGKLHFTTRQDIQFHKVTLQHTADLIERLLEIGIITRGTGGNTARNVVVSSLSGIAANEAFDVLPYGEATTSFLLKDPTTFNLPRKYKIGFSNTPEDTANATVSDLGFIAKIQGGKRGFEVYGGGGLGSNAAAAIKLEDFIPAEEVLYHVQTMKELFENEGDRTNKNKARIRYIVMRLGQEAFKSLYQETLQKVKREKQLELIVEDQETGEVSGEQAKMSSSLLVEQKEKGLYSVYVHPENGNINTKELYAILAFVDALGYETSIRFTNTQGFHIRDLRGTDADRLLTMIAPFASAYEIDNSIACTGAATCQLGLCLSQGLLSAIRTRFQNAPSAMKAELPRAFISGCPNSCGQHQIGKIGFSGKARRTEDGLIPMYTIYLGGQLGLGGAKLAKPYGDIPAKRIPDFLYDLAKLKHQAGKKDFMDFMEQDQASIQELIRQYSAVTPESQNADLYYDFGSCEKFSLKGRGPGECSAGVLDVIKLDLSNSHTFFEEYKRTQDSMKLYQGALSAARTLLVLKGVDTSKEREIFKEFTTHFVETGYVRSSIKELIDHLLDFKLGDIEDLTRYASDVEYLIIRVNAMYESLSPQLEITMDKEQEATAKEEPKSEAQTKIADLRGVKCPINFVKAKVELSKVAAGDIVGFYLDDGEPIQNVPRSLEAEGHRILGLDDQYPGYNLLTVQKGGGKI